MIHPATTIQYINAQKGYGVFATSFIPMGTMVYVKDALEIEVSPTAYAQHTPALQAHIDKYSYIDERGVRIISWDFAKYVNHCCHCNSMSTGYGFEIATRDILPGEEITDEYGLFNLQEPMAVQCGAPDCRRSVQPDDLDLLGAQWDCQVRRALDRLWYLEQPLWTFLDQDTLAALEEYRHAPSTYRSVQQLKCVPAMAIRNK